MHSISRRPTVISIPVIDSYSISSYSANQLIANGLKASALRGLCAVSDTTAALTLTVAQVVYGFCLLCLVPLGSKFERCGLVVCLMLLAAIGYFISGFTSNISLLFAGIVIADLFSVPSQILVSMASTLSEISPNVRAAGIEEEC